MIRLLEKNPEGICLYEMASDDVRVLISSFGATITRIETKDKDGHFDNIVLGYPTLADYQARSGTYFGATVGRVCNRIAKGAFTLNGIPCSLPVNNGPNSLHGGNDGFSYRNFECLVRNEHRLDMRLTSPDMDEGYPGKLDVTVAFTLEKNRFRIEFFAAADQDTLINMTNHTYFNLNGQDSDVLDHELKVSAERFGCVDSDGLATGQFREMANSCMDFRELRPLSQALDFEDEQVVNAFGLDHHFPFNTDEGEILLRDPKSHRQVFIQTSMPGAQFYLGNYLTECQGANGKTYGPRWGLAIEPQYMPDGIHNQEEPDCILRAHETYSEFITYTFSTYED